MIGKTCIGYCLGILHMTICWLSAELIDTRGIVIAIIVVSTIVCGSIGVQLVERKCK